MARLAGLMPADLMIRPETPGDIPAIREVVAAAFGQADEADLVDRLRADGNAAISLVAECDGYVVGHCLFSPLTAPFRALALAPVSVVPARQGDGIGSRLIRDGLRRAAGDGWRGIFVLGDPGYYRRFGFAPDLAAGFASPFSGPHLMALALGGALPATDGQIGYAPAFGGLD